MAIHYWMEHGVVDGYIRTHVECGKDKGGGEGRGKVGKVGGEGRRPARLRGAGYTLSPPSEMVSL